MRTTYGQSPWIRAVAASRRANYPPLRGDHEADVVIVGAGLTGCATAYACAGLGLSVIVVEADRVGAAMAGQGAGLLLPDPIQGFKALASSVGLRRARYSFDSWRHGALDAAATLRRLKVSCDLRPLRLVTAVTGSSLREHERELAARRAAGVAGSWLTSGPASRVANRRVDGALVHGAAFSFQPFKACIGMARAAVRRGAKCFEHSHVSRLRAGTQAVELILNRGTVQAQTVVVATGEATAEFPALQRHFVRRERYLVQSEPVSAPLRRKLTAPTIGMTDGAHPPLRLQWTADRCLLLTGGDQVPPRERQRQSVLHQRTGQLMYECLTAYPDILGLRPAWGWHQPYADTRDGLMRIGAHRHFPRHLFALGGADPSATGAFVAARILARTLSGKSLRADTAFEFSR